MPHRPRTAGSGHGATRRQHQFGAGAHKPPLMQWAGLSRHSHHSIGPTRPIACRLRRPTESLRLPTIGARNVCSRLFTPCTWPSAPRPAEQRSASRVEAPAGAAAQSSAVRLPARPAGWRCCVAQLTVHGHLPHVALALLDVAQVVARPAQGVLQQCTRVLVVGTGHRLQSAAVQYRVRSPSLRSGSG
jgi:hypothetical protein